MACEHVADTPENLPPMPGRPLHPQHAPCWSAIVAAFPGTTWTPGRLQSAAVGAELLELIGTLQQLHADGVEPATRRGAFTLERALAAFVLVLKGLDRPG